MNKKTLTRILALLLVLAMAAGLLILPIRAAESSEQVVIKLHYNRPDGDYTDWSVWFWNYGKEGVDIPFENVDGEMVATYPVDAGVTLVGFIVKLPNWAAKDVNEDQFIDVAAYLSGTVHVYVESGVKGYETVLGDDIVSGIKVKDAVYREGTGVQVTMTAEIDPQTLTLNGPEGPVSIREITNSGNTYTLIPDGELDLYGDYSVFYCGNEYAVSMPNVYSTASFEAAYTYDGDDLGAGWTAEKTTFRLWAPTASQVTVNLYESGTEGTDDRIGQLEMTPDVKGTWIAVADGDLNGVYYTYSVTVDGETNEACDPYARTTGVNGKRAMVIDLDSTDPEGWENDSNPHAGETITDAVIYELHVRDMSVDESSGIENKGKYLGMIETGTTNSYGQSTGLDHLVDLGITHLHLLPVYDYGSVDETRLDTAQFNWGYDPVNYNVPEGSYATDPYNGEVRVQEFKEMVLGLHQAGISVVMDVVYNHVYSGDSFCFNQIVPGYFSRITDSGVYSNGSGCGNDTASERAMVKKYIVDSVMYWVEEYHIDGFRFDLVGLLDTETINEIVNTVHEKYPDVIFYGEGWTLTTNVTKEGYTLATQTNSTLTPGFAYFNDTLRDALKGSVFDTSKTGYVSGASGYESKIASSFMGSVSWCKSPTQTINYASCHDNNTLYDRIVMSTKNASTEDHIRMNNLAAAIYMTSQGVPFIHAGEEILRSKPTEEGGYDHNSYSSSDAVNNLKWDTLNEEAYQQVYSYYKGLIAFRKEHPALRMTTSEEVSSHITSVSGLESNVTAFHISSGANGEDNEFFVIFNPRTESTTVELPAGEWTIYINADTAGVEPLGTVTGTVDAEAISAMVLIKTGDAAAGEVAVIETETIPVSDEESGNNNRGLIAVIAVLAVAAAATVVVVIRKRRNGKA